jgi:hypothetical protein
MTAKCACPNCNRLLEYDVNQSGTVIECPLCQKSLQLPASIPVGIPIPSDSVQTRGRDSARKFKGIGAFLMILGVPGCMGGAAADSNKVMFAGFAMFTLGITLFILGRFRE